MHSSINLPATNPTRPLLLRALRAAGIGSLAGALSGVAWGVLARIVMRIIARAMRRLPAFSWEGTLMIIIIGAIFGGLIGILYAGMRAIIPWGRIWKALILGLVLLLTIGVALYIGPLVQEGNPDVVPLAMGLFGASLLIWAGLIEALFVPLDRRLLNGAQGRLAAIVTSGIMALPPLMLAAMLIADRLGLMGE